MAFLWHRLSVFSAQNLWYMRQFYQQYHESPILQPLVGEIGWAHNLVVMGKCKDPPERKFYLRMTRRFGWTKNVLVHRAFKSFTNETREMGTSFVDGSNCIIA